jgi:THO complex subunit 2
MLSLSLLFDELVQAAIDQALGIEEAGSTAKDILAAPSSDSLDPVSLFLDTVSTLTETGAAPAQLKPFLRATGVDSLRMRSEFENNLLSSLDLVRPTFSRVAIRKATHALYRQSNYNLLREESEGYSKLITEYFTTVQGQPPTEEVVTDTFQRVKALIGAFDLDVGRVLDVTLDVFANLLVKHVRFFVKFLRASSWWPEQKIPHNIEWEEPVVSTLPRWASPGFVQWYYSDEEKEHQRALRKRRDQDFWKRVDEIGIKAYFELGARRITNGAPSAPGTEEEANPEDATSSGKKPPEPSDFENIQKWCQEWMAETKTLPPSGNRIAAQLLGFKLRFYASDARDAHDVLPDNLIHLSALLIKIGFISLADLYPHLYPLDEDMPAHRDRLMKEKSEKEAKSSSVPVNALALAAALPDDERPAPGPISRLRETESKASPKPVSERGSPSGPEEGAKEKLPEPVDQKVALLRSLLCIGAIPEALFILSRFPWLLDVYPDLHRYLFRLAHHSLDEIYEQAKPFSDPGPLGAKQGPAVGAPRASDYVPRRTLRWAKLEERDAGDGIDYRFYWDDWADNVPVCQNVDDLFRLCASLLKFVGLECGKDTVLLTKLVRIGRKSLAEDTSATNLQRWKTLSTTFLGPALTFSGENPGLVNETWELFTHFDTLTRYSIYENWFTGRASRKDAVAAKFKELHVDIKRLFNRVSKDNTKEMGRLMAKPAYASPGFVFMKALEQTEKYSNMTRPLVECCRYLTYLGYDCLNWAFINSLCKSRPTVQGDGMLSPAWLKSTASFIGEAYTQFSLMDPTPILQFVADQLLKGKLFALEILEQMLTSMAGIGPVLSLSEAQVYGLAMGPLLRAYTLRHNLGDKRHETKGSARRLLKSLKEADLAAQILVALAIELDTYAFREEFEEAQTPLKVIGTNLDHLHSNFAQYLDFLRSSLTVEDFDAMIPGVVELISEYGVEPKIAFTICRPSLSIKINASRAARRQSVSNKESPVEDKTHTNGDIIMNGTEEAVAPKDIRGGEAKTSGDVKMKDSLPANDVEMKDIQAEEAAVTGPESHESTASQTSRPNIEIQALANGLRYAMPDVYKNHICLNFFITFWQLSLSDVFTRKLKEYDDLVKDYTQLAKKASYAKGREYNEQSVALRQEHTETLKAALMMREKYLQQEMHDWFDGIPMVDAKSKDLHDTILQDCFLPRILLSPQDAIFSGAMLKFMHEVGVPGFRTMKFLDQLFKHKLLTNIIFMCSEREASNFGRFLNDILKDLNVWHATEANYTKFAQGKTKNLPGFGRTFNPDRTPATFLEYDDFRMLLYKWHTQINKALETCLKSDDYMHIRNAINVLKVIASSFPKVDRMGKDIYQMVQNLAENDSRPDLKLAAMSVLGDIKKGEKQRMTAQAFGANRNAPAAAPSAGRTGSQQSTTPQSREPSAAAALNAKAPEFKPRSADVNGSSHKPAGGQEDGEVQDSRDTDQETKRPTAAPTDSRSTAQAQHSDRGGSSRAPQRDAQSTTVPLLPSGPPVPRPEARGTTGQSASSSRVPHNLPPRPDPQPPRGRMNDRVSDRQTDYNAPNRVDVRTTGASEFGRLDRGNDVQRESFSERRDMSPGPRHGRTPERRDPAWGSRDARDARDPRDPRDMREPRDPRDYHDERAMRPPPRDMRPVPPPYHPRDPRDMRDSAHPRDIRDVREREFRGPPPPQPADGRGRPRPHQVSTPEESVPYRRDYPSQGQQGAERVHNLPPRQAMDRPATSAGPPGAGRPVSVSDRSMVNPERAALIGDDRSRNESFRSERDSHNDRGSRPQSPRRAPERAPAAYQGRNDSARDHPLERPNERPMHDRTPPHPFAPIRDRRDEANGVAPTGPRGARNEPLPPSRLSRDTFAAPSRPPVHQAQDPNYGRLNPPADTIPSGPRSKFPCQALSSLLITTRPYFRPSRFHSSGAAPSVRAYSTACRPFFQSAK